MRGGKNAPDKASPREHSAHTHRLSQGSLLALPGQSVQGLDGAKKKKTYHQPLLDKLFIYFILASISFSQPALYLSPAQLWRQPDPMLSFGGGWEEIVPLELINLHQDRCQRLTTLAGSGQDMGT